MIVSFTGHRPNKLDNDYDLVTPMVLEIKDKMRKVLLAHKPEAVITGMALGIDTLAADIAIEENIPFIAAIPFKGQGLNWPDKSRERYGRTLCKAIGIYVCDKSMMCNAYYEYQELPFSQLDSWQVAKYCNQRNRWMVDESQALIGVYDGSLSGGTYNTIQYAKKVKKATTIINI
jgi:uncharacterized phage-like protein YoqJ